LTVLLPYFIARRYLISKRKKNFINIISVLAVIGVAVSTAALIIVLSVFNGLGDLLHSLNNAFDPDIKVVASATKTFEINQRMIKKVRAIQGVLTVTEVIEDYAYARYRDANQVVTIKGVSDDFLKQHMLDDYVVAGKLRLWNGSEPVAIVGRGIQYYLSVAVDNALYGLQLYYVKDVQPGVLDPSRMYSHKSILPGAVFSILQDYDDNYVIVPLSFARDLMNYGNRRTALEIKLNDTAITNQAQGEIQSVLGAAFKVLNPEQQHQDLYRLLRFEKLFTSLSFILLLAIGSISIFFSLMMLAIDKRKDLSILAAMGATQQLIRNIFLVEGFLIGIVGTILGLALGTSLCWAQLHFGIISMGMDTAVQQNYPIKVVGTDLMYTIGVVAALTFAISYRPAWVAARSFGVRYL
jgi:lipoprotein-releasing system permease protein